MKTTVSEITLFTKCDFSGASCPSCGRESVLLATSNQYKNWCKACDIRFTDEGVVYGMPTL